MTVPRGIQIDGRPRCRQKALYRICRWMIRFRVSDRCQPADAAKKHKFMEIAADSTCATGQPRENNATFGSQARENAD